MELQSVAAFLNYYERIRSRTMQVIGVIPPERLEWSFREGKFSIGDQVRHIAATERYLFAEPVAGRRSCYSGCGRELADGYAPVLELVHRLHGESMDIFRSLRDADLQRPCETPGGGVLPVWKWLRAMVEHEVHHRGQVYLLLSMLGVDTPPMFGLTAEEVIAYSEA